jgi:N-acetylglutamate synthase-like GNAT family acetyltransferase
MAVSMGKNSIESGGRTFVDPNTHLLLRQAGERDVAAVTQLINAAFQVERFFLGADRLDAAEVRLRMQRGTFLLLEESGALEGCVYLEVRGENGSIGLLSVEPARQKSGLSRLLMSAAEAHFREQGCRVAELRTVNLRTELPSYYRHLGYEEVRTEPFPPEIPAILPCHFIVMTKALL